MFIHFSAVAPTYVKEIRDFVTDGQEIRVKILSISDEGKISLSIKQATDHPNARAEGGSRPQRPHQNGGGNGERYSSAASQPSAPASFDDMLSKFMQSSDEKISTLRRNNGDRRSSRRGNGSGSSGRYDT